MQQEIKKGMAEVAFEGNRVFGIVCKGFPTDFQMWLDSAKAYGIYIVFSKSTRTGKLVIKEEAW